MQFFFFPYIFFGAFVILSLLTGVMADHMNEVRRNEEQAPGLGGTRCLRGVRVGQGALVRL